MGQRSARAHTGAPGQVDNNYVGVPITRNRTDQFDVKVDHNPSGFTIFGRYSFRDTNQFQPAPRPGLAEGSTNDTYGYALLRSQASPSAGLGHKPGAGFRNACRLLARRLSAVASSYNSGCPDALIGLKGLSSHPSLCGGLPPMGLPGGNLRRLSRTTSVPQIQTPRSYNIRQSLTWVKGSHTMKFGGEYLHLQTGVLDFGNLLGNFSFTGRFSGQNNQYQGGIADMLLATQLPWPDSKQCSTCTSTCSRPMRRTTGECPETHAEHRPAVRIRTTPRGKDNMWRTSILPRRSSSAKGGSLFDQALIPRVQGFAPRVGIAYSASSRTVVRAATGSSITIPTAPAAKACSGSTRHSWCWPVRRSPAARR